LYGNAWGEPREPSPSTSPRTPWWSGPSPFTIRLSQAPGMANPRRPGAPLLPVRMSILQPSFISRIGEPRDVSALWTSAPCVAKPWLCAAILLVSDVVAVALGAILSIAAWPYFNAALRPDLYVRLWPVLILFPLAYAASGLYPAFGRNPVEE